MKYFTPELYVRGQSRDDDVLDEVDGLWEEAGDRYLAYLKAVRPTLPVGLVHILDSYYLHDAAKAAIEDPKFVADMNNRGIDVDYRPGNVLKADLWREYKTYTELLRRVGLKKN